jgi:hypothetical protein
MARRVDPEFWDVYPRKFVKDRADKAFCPLAPNDELWLEGAPGRALRITWPEAAS